MTPFRVPPLWEGRTVAVLASGPSMSLESARKVRAAGLPAIVTNRTYELAPWADVLVANDLQWWRETPQALGFKGMKLCLQDGAPAGVMTLDNDARKDVRAGGNSGYTAAWLAAKEGAARILLCGLDMRGGHWHVPHPEPLRRTPEHAFRSWAKRFEPLAAALRGRVEVLNCTPGSAVTCFPFCDLDEALETESACSIS